MSSATSFSGRSVAGTARAVRTLEGAGVEIRRVFPTSAVSEIDPFLLLDEMGPAQFAAGSGTGFPDHPHRGFETVTYLLEGQMEHRDSFGNRGLLEAGDVQWMTAGSGLVHSEMPGPDLVRKGGRLHGFQIWVNLPARDKMAKPRYQELKSAEVPVAESEGVRARVIAGESLGLRGAVESHTPITVVHLTLEPGTRHVQEAPKAYDALAYVFGGRAAFPGLDGAPDGTLVLFGQDGERIAVSNPGTEPLELLVLAGEPIREPIVRQGPFVVNTREELYRAFDDYRRGKMGSIGRG